MSYWSIWDPRWLPWRTPPLPTTIHRLQVPSPLSDGGRPGWGREARARARCSSLPWSPRGGDSSQGTDLSCCTNTGMSRRPAEQARVFRCFRHQRGWQGSVSREAERFKRSWREGREAWWMGSNDKKNKNKKERFLRCVSLPDLWVVGSHRREMPPYPRGGKQESG